jgi:hypothetical protein
MPYWKRPRLSPRSARSTSRFCSIGGSPPTCSPLPGQIQIAADFAKGTTARLAGAEVPSYADDEASFAALRQRIAKTVSFVQTFKPADIDGSETGTSRSSCAARRFASKVSLISCTSHSPTSIFTPQPPTISCALAAWGSASATFSVRSKSRISRRICSGS